VLTAAAATAVALSAQTGAHADPKPTKDEVKAQVDKLNTDEEAQTERYNKAKERGDQLRVQAAQLQDQVARGQERVTRLRSGLAAVAADQYRNGGIDPTVQLMLDSDPAGYLDAAASMKVATATQSDALKSLQAEQRRLDQEKQEAAATLAELDRTTKELGDAKAQIQAKLAEATRLLNSLSAADRAALQQADQAASRGATRADLANLPPASGYAATAVAAALGKQGSLYVWGSNGPTTFDCSGLTQWAYAQAGVSLPRTTWDQALVGTRVPSLAQAQPGDLVIYGADQGHMGMYIGNNLVVHAPHAGAPVRVADALSIGQINVIRRP
jgi:cell wall-associated NlpC family hydrolase